MASADYYKFMFLMILFNEGGNLGKLTLCPLPPGKCFIFFKIKIFRKILSGLPSECQTIWILIRPRYSVGPYLGPNCLQKLSAEDPTETH